MMDAAGLREFIREHFTRTAYRREALPAYEVDSDKGVQGSDYDRYRAGAAEPARERKQPWQDRLRAERDRGLYRHRVRLLHDPLHPYEKYECEWGYALNVPAGEDIRIIDPTEQNTPTPVVDHDYWLIDDQHPLRMHYADNGEFVGASLAPELLEQYRTARDAAWAAAEPFTDWWARHPEHHRATRGAS